MNTIYQRFKNQNQNQKLGTYPIREMKIKNLKFFNYNQDLFV